MTKQPLSDQPIPMCTTKQFQDENEALQLKIEDLAAENYELHSLGAEHASRIERQRQLLDQLSEIASACYIQFPEYTQSVPTVRHGESPLLSVVRSVVNSLGQRVKEVEAANMRAKAASKAKDHFLATMSHEIRTPMNGVIGMIELLGSSKLDDEQREFVEVMRRSAMSLLSLLNDILDYSKLSASSMVLEQRIFNPEHVIADVLKTFVAKATEKNIELEYSIAAGFPDLVLGDCGRTRQVLSNLVSNAIKFTHEGGVRVFASLGEGGPDWAKLLIDVTDTGIGMSATELEHVFAPFTQSDASTSRKFGGSGLGLAISRELLALMSGTLNATSEPGRGSCFRMELGAQLPKPSEVRTHLAKANGDKGFGPGAPQSIANRILLVEDNPVNQRVAQLMLERLGYEARLAGNGYEAVDIATKENFELICMDVSMPGIDGCETTRRIRALDTPTANAWIIAMTGHAFEDDRRLCREAGMDGFVAKPYTATALREALEAACPRSETCRLAA